MTSPRCILPLATSTELWMDEMLFGMSAKYWCFDCDGWHRVWPPDVELENAEAAP